MLDGFPRTLHQARELDRVIAGCPLDLVIDLDVPREIVFDRIAGPARLRGLPARCTTSTCRPNTVGCCDTCGGNVRQRDDDTDDAVERRLELYERETVPIVDVLPGPRAC